MSDSVRPCGLYPAGFLCPWDSPGPEVGYHFVFQGIFPTQGSNPCLSCLLHWRSSLPLVPHRLGATILRWFHLFSLVRGWVGLERLVPHFWAGFSLTSNVSHCPRVALLLLNVGINRVLAKVAFSLVRVFRLLPRLGWCISHHFAL